MLNNKSMTGLLRAMRLLLLSLLVLLIMLSAAGCASPEEGWSVTFGDRFFKLAQTTPEEWAEKLCESNPERANEVSIRGSTVRISSLRSGAKGDWEGSVNTKIYYMDQDFGALPGHCRIGHEYGVYTWMKFCLDTKNCDPVDEGLICEVRRWFLCGQIIGDDTKDADLVDVSVEVVDSHPVSLEKLIEYSNLTAASLEGIDHEAFLQYHGVHTDNLEEFKSEWFSKMLDHYKFYLNELEWEKTAVDYNYICDQAQGTLKAEDLDCIDVVCFDYNDNSYYESGIIDFTTGKVYKNEYKVDDRDITAYTADGDREWLRDVLEQCGITGWNNFYDGTSEGTTGHFYMYFAFRLSDGRCVSYSADGVIGYKPSGMFTLHDALTERYFTAE